MEKDMVRSERAKRLHAEMHPDDPTRRKFGGPQPGSGRPKVKRASTRVAEAAATNADKIIEAFKRGVGSVDERTAVMAAEKWLGVERQEASLQIEEARAFEEMTRGDLIELLADGFERLDHAGVIEGFATDVQGEPVEPNPFLALDES